MTVVDGWVVVVVVTAVVVVVSVRASARSSSCWGVNIESVTVEGTETV
jgi:hypothetical protein